MQDINISVFKEIKKLRKKENRTTYFPSIAVLSVVAFCILVDFITLYSNFDVVLVDHQWMVIMFSFASACILDMSPYLASIYLQKEEKKKSDYIVIIGLALIFIGMIVILFWMRLKGKADMFTSARTDFSSFMNRDENMAAVENAGWDKEDYLILFMSILPIFTSVLSFLVSYLKITDEKKERIRENSVLSLLELKQKKINKIRQKQNDSVFYDKHADNEEFEAAINRLEHDEGLAKRYAKEELAIKIGTPKAVSNYLE